MQSHARLITLLSLALLCVLPAQADTLPHIPGGPKVADCSKARDPYACEARIAARQACQHKQGSDKRQCMDARKVLPECRPDTDPVRCSQKKRAEQICRKRTGKPVQECIKQETRKLAARL